MVFLPFIIHPCLFCIMYLDMFNKTTSFIENQSDLSWQTSQSGFRLNVHKYLVALHQWCVYPEIPFKKFLHAGPTSRAKHFFFPACQQAIPSKKRSLTLSNQHLSFVHTSVILVGLWLRDAIISCEETYCNYWCVQPVFKILHETVSETFRFLVVTPPVISAGCPRHCHMVPVTSFHHPLINRSPGRTALRWLCCVCRQINLRSFWGKRQEPIR